MWYEESPSEGGCETLVANAPNDQKSVITNVTSPAVTAMPVSSLVSTPANRLDLPHNFYWAIPGKLIGMGCPTKKKHIENLVEHYKVSVVVNLRECRTGQQLFEDLPVNNVHFPIKSFDVPTMEQAQQFICCVDEVLEPDPPKDKDKEEEEEIDAPSECGHANKSENNERKDYRNGTQASNIDAGRCNDCFSANSKPRWKKMKRNRHGMSMTEFVCDMEKNGDGGTSEGIVIRSNKKKKRNKPSEEDNKRTKPVLANMHAVAVNCRWGKGRTGTMICCYLVHKEGITAHEAICRVRALSPCSIETKGQEEFVEEFYRLKMVAAGREADYTRSLPYPYVPQHHNYRTNNVPVVSVANATYGPASRGCAQRMASANNKVCFNNPLLLAKMYK